VYSARFCVMATGCLSDYQNPNYPGVEDYKGKMFHTGRWPHESIDFQGKKVAIIGTGSSAIQAIPELAQQAAHLYVFQRTPNFSVPAKNYPLDPLELKTMKENYSELRTEAAKGHFGIALKSGGLVKALDDSEEDRKKKFEESWKYGGFSFTTTYCDLLLNREANETAGQFVREKIKTIVKNSQVAEMLCPTNYPLGSKRICLDTNYLETYNRDNVTLIDIKNKSPIESFTASGIKTKDATYDVDYIILATGWDSMVGALHKINIKGRDGVTLKEKWINGPITHLGLMTNCFPNFFIVTGPGSPSVLSNMIISIEVHVNWIADCLKYLKEKNYKIIEATEKAEIEWTKLVEIVANFTLFPVADSWYVGANTPGKPRVFLPYIGGCPAYVKKLAEVVSNNYEGFVFS